MSAVVLAVVAGVVVAGAWVVRRGLTSAGRIQVANDQWHWVHHPRPGVIASLRPGDVNGVAGTASPLVLALPVAVLGGLVFEVMVTWADVGSAVGASAALGLFGAVAGLIATAGVRVRDGRVKVVGMLAVTSVPPSQITSLTWTEGFDLVITGRGIVGTMALGDSLIGQLTGNRRALQVAARLSQWAIATSAPEQPKTVTVRWRWGAFAVAVVWAVTVLLTVDVPFLAH